jgi:phytoene desaturase
MVDSGSSPYVAVVGGGLGGLSAALTLARAGADVHLFEKESTLGGKVAEHRGGGFRFDTGPHLLTMPEVLQELIGDDEIALQSLPVRPLPELCRYHFSNGKVLQSFSPPERFAQEIARVLGDDEAEAFLRFMQYAAEIFTVSAPIFIFRPFLSWRKLAEGSLGETRKAISKIDALRTVAKTAAKAFRTPEMRQIMERFATYTGSSPYRAPATLNVIPHIEFGGGGYHVPGGMFRIIQTLGDLCRKNGVRIDTGSPVRRIAHRKGRVTTLETESGSCFEVDAVIANSDVVYTFDKLLDPPPLKRHILNRFEPSCAGLVFLWGVRGTTDLSYHNIFFAGDYRAEFEAIFSKQTICNDPTTYVCITSRENPADAPTGCENWFVLINAPYLKEKRDLPEVWERTRRDVLRKLTAAGYDIADRIIYEHRISPFDLMNRTNTNCGSIYGLSSNGLLSALHRHPNRSPGFANLYHASGSAHPGGGIPLSILSGKHAAQLCRSDFPQL